MSSLIVLPHPIEHAHENLGADLVGGDDVEQDLGDLDEAFELGGRLFVRNVCMAFDRYLPAAQQSKPVFSRTV